VPRSQELLSGWFYCPKPVKSNLHTHIIFL